MAISQSRPRRKVTGSRFVDLRKKKQYELGRDPTGTKLGVDKKKSLRVRAGKKKDILLTADTINLMDPKTKKSYGKLQAWDAGTYILAYNSLKKRKVLI